MVVSQLFLVVWAMKEVYSCFILVLLLHAGQLTMPVPCSFNVVSRATLRCICSRHPHAGTQQRTCQSIETVKQ
jgi:hypothetical protein